MLRMAKKTKFTVYFWPKVKEYFNEKAKFDLFITWLA